MRPPFAPINWIYPAAFSALTALVLGVAVTTLRLNSLVLANHQAIKKAAGENLQIERCKRLVSDVRYLELASSDIKSQDRSASYRKTARSLETGLEILTNQASSNPEVVRPRGARDWTPSRLDEVSAVLNKMGEESSARQAGIERDWRQHEEARLIATRLIGITLLVAIFGLGYLSKRQSATSRKEWSAANELQLRMKWLALHFPVPAVYVEGELVIINRCAQELTGYSRREVTTLEEWFTLLHPEHAAAARKGYEEAKRDGFKFIPTFTIIRKDGEPLQIELAAHSGRGGEVWVLRDVTELFASRERLQDANRKLQELAAIDGLTGVMNRRVFFVRLREECDLALQLDRVMSVLIFDVDHFKAYNDAFGHPEGDHVLRTIGELVRESSRAFDSVARYGGEEFALILPGTGREEALQVADQLRRCFEGHRFRFRQVTVSIGVATTREMPTDPDILVADADRALYAAKHAGRNTVVHADDIEPPAQVIEAA